jgi:hypothetical protein
VLNRKGGEVNGQLPITLKSSNIEQVKAWLEELQTCRQLSREELADEPDPEFETVSEMADKVDRVTARRQSSADIVDLSPSLKSGATMSEQAADSSRQESIVEDDRIQVETIVPESLSATPTIGSMPSTPTTPTVPTFQRLSSRSSSTEEPLRKEPEETLLKRTHSRDLPEGLPKPIKSSDSSKRNSLSRQTSQVDPARKGDRTPETSLSRKNSTTDKSTVGSGSRLSSRKSSVNSDKGEPISRRGSTKQLLESPIDAVTGKPTSNVPSRRGSKTGSNADSATGSDSQVADVQMYEESQTVPVSNSAVEQDLGRAGSKRTTRQLSLGTPKPKVKRDLQDCEVGVEDVAKFECQLDEECASIAAVEWLREGKVLNLAGRYRAFTEGSLHMLQISRVIDEDAGQYTALITTGAGQVRSTARLTVKPELGGDTRPCTPGGSLLPAAPAFKIRLKDTKLLLGSKVRFELLVYAHPHAVVTFSKDGLPLRESDRVHVKRKSGESFELVIDKIELLDAGSYSVRAWNDHGEDHTSCVLSIHGAFKVFRATSLIQVYLCKFLLLNFVPTENDKDVFKYLPEDAAESADTSISSQILERQSSVQSPGMASRPRTPAFKWFRDGNEFDASERFLCQFNEDEDTIGLIFQHVTPEDAGLYTCVASTQGGKISCSAELTVQGEVNRLLRDPEPPRFETQLTDAVVNQGSTATIEVKVKGYPRPTITWMHDGEPITLPSDKHKLLYEQDDTMTLIIKNAQPEDAGRYELSAKNELGEAVDQCKLQVQSAPNIIESLKDTQVKSEEPLKLAVKVRASPAPEVKWFKDGKPLETDERLQPKCNPLPDDLFEFTLTSDKAQLTDTGHYSCTVSNACGQQSSDCELTVQG